MVRDGAKKVSGVLVVLGAGAMLAAMGTGCGAPPKPFHMTETNTLRANAADVERLELTGRIGDIHVVGDPAATEIVAEVTRTGWGTTIAEALSALEEIEVTLASHDAAEKTIKAHVDHPLTSYTRAWEVDWRVTAPPEVALKLRTGVGDADVRDFERGLEVETGVGDVRIERVSGNVRVRSGVGDLHIREVRGDTRATAEVGDIHASGAGGFYLRGSTGDIHLALAEASAGDIEVASSVGDVVVHMPADQRGRLTAGTSVGSVNCNLEDIPISHFRHSSHRFSGNLHAESEPKIELRTSVGDLVVQVK